MNRNPVQMFMLSIGLTLLASVASASTFKCDAVDDLSRLGYDGGQNVSIIGENKVCKFSIGGASADGMSPPRNFEGAQDDRVMLTRDPQRFIAERLTLIILEAAAAFGETGNFVTGLTPNSDLSNLSCSSEGSVSVDSLQIRCVTMNDMSQDTGQNFENGIITAVLFRPTFVFEILDNRTSATALVIFIPF